MKGDDYPNRSMFTLAQILEKMASGLPMVPDGTVIAMLDPVDFAIIIRVGRARIVQGDLSGLTRPQLERYAKNMLDAVSTNATAGP